MKTFSAKAEEINREWFLIDAEGKTLGRMATEIALRLRGKHKPEFTPHVDTGDFVVVINADKFKVTGKKTQEKIYYRHTGFPGGIKDQNLEELLAKKPTEAFVKSVKGMLPSGPLGNQMLTKLKVYAGTEHPHAGQNPKALTLNK